jgi:hypothetical protein
VSQNHKTTGAKVRAQHSSWRSFLQKQSNESFTILTSTVELQLLNFWLVKTMLKGKKDCVIRNFGHLMIGYMLIWSDGLSFTLFPTSGWVCVWRMPNEACISECLAPTVTQGGGSVIVWAAISWYSAGPTITVNCWITAYWLREHFR